MARMCAPRSSRSVCSRPGSRQACSKEPVCNHEHDLVSQVLHLHVAVHPSPSRPCRADCWMTKRAPSSIFPNDRPTTSASRRPAPASNVRRAHLHAGHGAPRAPAQPPIRQHRGRCRWHRASDDAPTQDALDDDDSSSPDDGSRPQAEADDGPDALGAHASRAVPGNVPQWPARGRREGAETKGLHERRQEYATPLATCTPPTYTHTYTHGEERNKKTDTPTQASPSSPPLPQSRKCARLPSPQ